MEHILEGNRRWVASKLAEDPEYFQKLATGQKPRYLFIGCSDSRVPGSAITGTAPGEMFTHRNIANVVVNTDLNLLSVLQYAVEVLEVKIILVVGHYGCGGVAAAASNKQYGLIDNWLTNVRDVVRLHETELLRIADPKLRMRRLVELNVIEQVRNLAKTNIIQNAMRSDNPPILHGLVYDLADGVLKDLEVDNSTFADLQHIYGTEVYEEEATETNSEAEAPAALTAEKESSTNKSPKHDPAQVPPASLTK